MPTLIRKGSARRLRRRHFDVVVEQGDAAELTDTEAEEFLRDDPEGWELVGSEPVAPTDDYTTPDFESEDNDEEAS